MKSERRGKLKMRAAQGADTVQSFHVADGDSDRGSVSFGAFFLVLGGLIERLGVAGGFVAASVAALAIQAGSLAFVVRPGHA